MTEILETFKDAVIALTFAGICAIGAYLLKTYKQQILTLLTDLIQKAEQAIQGSGLGAEKKSLVVAQLEAMGITVTSWVSEQIDTIVAYLNEKGAWFAGEATETVEEAIEEAAAESTGDAEAAAETTEEAAAETTAPQS